MAIMSLTIPFCLVMSTLVAAKSTSMYRIAVESHSSRSTENENLKIILNYVRSKQKFYPSIFSLVSSDVRSNFADLVSKYIASESIVSYKITMNDLSRRYTWQNRADLTWIFIIDDINVLKFFVLEQSYIWKATNQYLVIITIPIPVVSRDIFQTIWKTYNVYKIVFVSIQDNFRCLSRYLPFEKNRQNEYGAVRKICLMNQTNNIELYTNFENLNGYPIRVIVFGSLTMNTIFDEDTRIYKYKGLDADAMFLLEKSMGAQFRINVIATFSTNFTKGKNQDRFQHSLQYIQDDKSDIVMNGFFIYKYEKYQNYEFTTSVYEDKLCLIAPTSGFIPKSYMPIMPFALDLWTALAIYNILVSILWFLIKYYSGSFRRQEAVLLPLIRTEFILSRRTSLPPRIHPYVLSCFDLVETSCYPLKDSPDSTTAQRVFLFGTLFFGLIIVGLYQSYLVSVLSNPLHYPELNTLEDVANSNFSLGTKYYNLKEHTFTENTTLFNKLRRKIKVINTDKMMLDIVAFDKLIAITRYASLKIDDLSKYYDADGNELFHLVEECPNTFSLSYVMRLYLPYRERINWLLLRMQEAGLINLWYDNMTYPTYVAEQKRKVEKSERRITLTMNHYSLTFVGLSIGLLFCIVVFLAELYFAKKSQSYIGAEKILDLISKN
ncbi:uncharacterized protein LOC126850906 [Cataglyphis hispanica]|uniref:uncharacterized protein LOC126850906 n=1 Tax=Cataglyphis hispanica TaxID=1086592 RepID=UPI00217F7817|nr:uncharacterized protein LOC126850906 [Cataglyphis hispanica]